MYKYAVIFLLSLLSLVGCLDTIERVGEAEHQEAINAYVFDKGKLYVVGQYHDFEFTGNEVAKNIEKLKSPPYKNSILAVHLNMNITDHSRVWAVFSVYLNLDDRAEKEELEQQKLHHKYTFVWKESLSPDILEKIGANNPNWDKNRRIYVSYFSFDGQVIKLANRDEILQKYRLKVPLIANINYYKSVKKFIPPR